MDIDAIGHLVENAVFKNYKQRPLSLHICVVLVLTSNRKCQGQSHGSARVSSRGSNKNGKFSSLRSRKPTRIGVSAIQIDLVSTRACLILN